MTAWLLAGNTTIKVACGDAQAISVPADASAGEIAPLLAGCEGVAVAASVNPTAEIHIGEACRKTGFEPPLYAGRDFPTGVDIDLAAPEKVGIDRVLNVKAAWQRARDACAAVDLGTAVSISVADAAGRFVGGAIFPGLRASLACLHEKTAFLPAVELAPPASSLGRDTASAVRSGVVYGAEGAVKEIVSRISDTLGQRLAVILTGGDCDVFGQMPLDWQIVPELTMEGLRLAWRESQ